MTDIDIEKIKSISGLSHQIINYLILYQEAAIFFGAFFFAESVILAASFLAANGLWSVSSVFIFCLLGTLLSDLFWFFLGMRFLKITGQWFVYKSVYDKITKFLDKLTKNKPFLALLFIKFLYGTRFLTIVYLSIRKISLRNFILYDLIGTSLWLCVIVPIGWLAGRGASHLISIYRGFNYTILALIIFLILFKTIEWLFLKLFQRRVINKL